MYFSILPLWSPRSRPTVDFSVSSGSVMLSMRSSGSSVLPFDLDILSPSASRTMALMYTCRNGTAGEMLRHHDHPGDTEDNDVEACHQHRGREKGVEVFGLFGPAKRSEGHQRRRKPSVEYVIVALERTAISFRGSPFFSLGFVAADIDIALVVIPRRDLMTPPQLARDAPILDLFQPLPVPSGPILRKELDVPLCHPFE